MNDLKSEIKNGGKTMPVYVKIALILALFVLAFMGGRLFLGEPVAAATYADDAKPMEVSASAGSTMPPDLEGKPYASPIFELIKGRIITGDIDGLFHGDKQITRAEACAMIIRTVNPSMLYGTPTQDSMYGGRFNDMSGALWAEPFVDYAAAKGIVKGYGDGTFRPGMPVNSVELFAMVLRASGVNDAEIIGDWKQGYIKKAARENLLNGMVDLSSLPESEKEKAYLSFAEKYNNAPKWLAGYCIYNKKSEIEKFAAKTREGNAPKPDNSVQMLNIDDYKFTKDMINSEMNKFGDMKFSDNLKVYAYGKKADYKKNMEFPKNAELQLSTIYKYKNTETPAWYKTDAAGRIEAMILPMDVGFSGRAYGVINGIGMAVNAEEKAVKTLESIVAGKTISWLCLDGISSIPSTADIFKGDIYEINLHNGEVQSVFNVTQAFEGKLVELNPGNTWTELDSAEPRLVKIKSGNYVDIRENAICYKLSADGQSYTLASTADIVAGQTLVRLFEISEDKIPGADLVVIKEQD